MGSKRSYKGYYILLVSMTALVTSISLAGFSPLELIFPTQSNVPEGFFPSVFVVIAHVPFVLLLVAQMILVVLSALSLVRFVRSKIASKQKYVLIALLLVAVYVSATFSHLLAPKTKELQFDSMSQEELIQALENGENVFLPVD